MSVAESKPARKWWEYARACGGYFAILITYIGFVAFGHESWWLTASLVVAILSAGATVHLADYYRQQRDRARYSRESLLAEAAHLAWVIKHGTDRDRDDALVALPVSVGDALRQIEVRRASERDA